MLTAQEYYLTSETGAVFLRLETPRERLALPYATLLGLSLSVDDATLELDFASHKITVKGKRLYEVFCAISAGRSSALFARSEVEELALGSTVTLPIIAEIRIREVTS
jgi:hypothetical protein